MIVQVEVDNSVIREIVRLTNRDSREIAEEIAQNIIDRYCHIEYIDPEDFVV